MSADKLWFQDARYGIFIHYGLYSLLGRGEWVLNREQIPLTEYAQLAREFRAKQLDFDDLLRRAKEEWGMRYAILTTKHHEGFCLYDSSLTTFTAPPSADGRDLVEEFVRACRKHGLKVGLYHSLNDWSTCPNAVDALERPTECYQPFIDFVHSQIREILTNYGQVDILWYDGWWPFNGSETGWQAAKLNAMARSLQPGILVNGRCGLPGDFATPEGHITSSTGMWEACMTLNNNWGYHRGDQNWKSPKDVAEMLRKAATGRGNLLLNVGPMGDGTIPQPTIDILNQVGQWLKVNAEAIYATDCFELSLRERGNSRSDWTHHGQFTARGNHFYLHIHNWPGSVLVLTGLECQVEEVKLLSTGKTYPFRQENGKLTTRELPDELDISMPVVLRFRTKDIPCLYRTGGYQNPQVPHCRYDPMPSDIA